MERFLYRLSVSPHRDCFVLKGALMLQIWKLGPTRPTMDIDLLGRTDNNLENIMTTIKEICSSPVEPDGLDFDSNSVTAENITANMEYVGVRVKLLARLSNVRIHMQIDIGFGDTIIPCDQMFDYPTLLDYPSPRIHGYSRESTIAEKFHAMVQHGRLNSRMKDFYDTWFLTQNLDFELSIISTAIRTVFENRDTKAPLSSTELLRRLAGDPVKSAQWKGFIHNVFFQDLSIKFPEIAEMLITFFNPVLEAMHNGNSSCTFWKHPGPWH
ncbi:MAG: nucleotidyl transferase AbiEii/AbiGii toxin family protein [Candidatus Wallbacteria bacterium]|nr:nucleotidyl transferase AbiEii/AbiGii toxin family protein [Candidatus Wallbacteria bacterium]